MSAQLHQDMYYAIKEPWRYTYLLEGPFGERFLDWLQASMSAHRGYILWDQFDMRVGKPLIKAWCLPDELWFAKRSVFVCDLFPSWTWLRELTRETRLPKPPLVVCRDCAAEVPKERKVIRVDPLYPGCIPEICDTGC